MVETDCQATCGECRGCRLRDRLTDKAMGSDRSYIARPALPTREQNYENRRVIANNVTSNKITRSQPRKPINKMTDEEIFRSRNRKART